MAMCALWAQSYWTAQFVGWSGPNSWVGALSMGGLLRFERANYAEDAGGWNHVSYATPGGSPPGLWSEVYARDRDGGPLRRVGFAYAHIDYGKNGTMVRNAVYLPHWAAVVLLAVAPAVWVRRFFAASPWKAGRCKSCGYDLTGNMSGICPECGAVVKEKT